jgi:purine-nucleoside phosphorylase
MLEKIKATSDFIISKTGFGGKIAVILGSGLGGFINNVEIENELLYSEIPNFPVSTVEGHAGKLIFGKIKNHEILVMQGRFHYYEGYTMEQVSFPVRVFRQLGIDFLFVSNAAGGINYSFEVGNVMMITDHINLTGTNPLIGKNYNQLGPRFPDLTHAYNPGLCEKAREIAKKHYIQLQEGTYVGLTGPSFETPAEYRFLHTIGGDAVGMSTVPEVIVANHMGMKVFGISVITNNGLIISEGGNKHTEVLDVAAFAGSKLETIFCELISTL